MKINCIIIDDDVTVTAYLKGYISQLSFLNLCATFHHPVEGLKYLEEENIQVVFMDIGMPEMTGMDLTRLLHNQLGPAAPQVVFVTGFERYAVDGFSVGALDYIVKPVTFDRFAQAAYKARSWFERPEGTVAKPASVYQPHDFIFLRVEQELVRVYLKDILYIESCRDYIRVCLAGEAQEIVALSTLKSMEEKLPAEAFMRVHRSFIVSLDKISAIQHQTIRIGKKLIPVSEQYRQVFREFTHRWF